jgi:hypothetical protein
MQEPNTIEQIVVICHARKVVQLLLYRYIREEDGEHNIMKNKRTTSKYKVGNWDDLRHRHRQR